MKSSSWIEWILKKPHIIISFLALFLLSGIVGYEKLHRNLFPNSNYPEVAIVIVEPGASAKTVASNIAVPIEEELYTLDEIRRAYSTTIDEVTVIKAEFEYTKDIDTALNDVSNAISKIKRSLPSDILEPQVIKITETTAPIAVVSISAKDKQTTLEDIREIAEVELKHKLLTIKGIANVDIFGGYQKELQIIVDKEKLKHYNLSFGEVVAQLKKNNSDFAIGLISNSSKSYLLTSSGKRDSIEALKKIPLRGNILLEDIAQIYFGHYENKAAYYGNGKAAIALSVQRTSSADVIQTIAKLKKALKEFEAKYPNLNFEISDTQEETIVQSTTNMFEALRDAIVMSTIVVFMFLASFRQILVVLVTIPLVYASTIALMWLFGMEFDVVTLTAIILALGLLLDDTVVVMENIERHYKELGKEIHAAVYDGTKEIMFADFSGTVTTMIALSPMLFVGGYPQTVFAPLVGTLLLALLSSYFISIIAVPWLSMHILTLQHPWILRAEEFFHKIVSILNDTTQSFFATIVDAITSSKKIAFVSIVALLLLFVTSVKIVMPTVGQELMPPMDTGVVNIKVTMQSNLPIQKSQETMQKLNEIIKSSAKTLRISGSIGSEAGVLSIGSGSGFDHISIVATYVDRYQRKESIWDIARDLRNKIAKLENIKSFEVTPYGATALASIRANVDAKLSSDNLEDLLKAAPAVLDALNHTKGVVSTATTWQMDKVVYDVAIDEKMAQNYHVTREDITKQLQLFSRGAIVATFPRANAKDYDIRLWIQKEQISDISKLLELYIDTPKGKIPLAKVAKLTKRVEPTLITREALQYTLEIYGDREKAAISHIMSSFEENLKKVHLPEGVTLEQIGDIKQFKESAKRMIGAIITAVVLIFLTLVMMFGNLKISAMILFSIPLTVIGASWTMLAMGYHTSMPAMMGFMLLSGIIVNNAILLIHFAIDQIKKGIDKKDAMLEAIRIRTRPVLMTAFAVSAGMLPVATGSAIGLERLAPLGAVAIGGLVIGTFMTLVFIPSMFIWFVKDHVEDESEI